ncbi:hypothetical protein GPUN_1056 [Glaciecola punicea ACAM 611]|uniref:Response regulatory domain-containing protein n=1 Tax=Glaciecola punicea ACAM 611 TaxID=1121923 RepID=H5TA60_9ALTE|nr:hypothetical protein [Glaciecola punicea]GAB55187.1 hypothetical protein GPUN_1056 [Glaciecola punicea ACAM 611]
MPTSSRSTGRRSRLLRVSTVEGNATARSNLRSHLMSTEHLDLENYSNEGELKNGLQLNNFDLVLMDYHFRQSKNGAE